MSEPPPHKAAFLLLPLLGARSRLDDVEGEALVALARLGFGEGMSSVEPPDACGRGVCADLDGHEGPCHV